MAWRIIRVDALKRDRWTCRECGWQPDIVKQMARLNLDAPPDAVLMELSIRRRSNDTHLQVDHIVPISEAPHRRLDLSNLQTLCSRCHSAKTMRETNSR